MKKGILLKTFIRLLMAMLLLVVVIHISIFFFYQKTSIANANKKLNGDLQYISELLKKYDDAEQVLKSFVKSNKINVAFNDNGKIKYFYGTDLHFDYFSNDDSLLELSGLDGSEAVIFKTKKLDLSDNDKEVYVQASMTLQHLTESKKIALSLLPYSLFISVVFSMIFSYFYSRKLTRPILSMNKSVKSMTNLDKDARVYIKNKDEIGLLAQDINLLYENLLKVIEDYQYKTEEVLLLERERLIFFRSASHECKTPLAKLQVLMENMRYGIGKYKDHDKYLGEAISIVNELSIMISDILKGVKSLDGKERIIRSIYLRRPLEEMINRYNMIAKSKHIVMEIDIQSDMLLILAPDDLDKVISNILSNAIKYTKEYGRIRIFLSHKEFHIYNEAERISQKEMDTIWENEYILQNKEDFKSSGLGLHIVKDILDRNGIRFTFNHFDKGYIFKITK